MREKFVSFQENNPLVLKALEILYVVVGSAIIAIGFNVFLLPHGIASGGVSGISTILNSTLGLKPAYVLWAFNIPIFISGLVFLGWQFAVKSLVGTFFLPLFVLLTENWEPATVNPLLGAIFGGISIGLGLGIVFRGFASTGGTDTVAQIVHKYTGLTLGTCVALIDGMIVIAATLLLDIEKGLLAIIGLFVTTKTIDAVQLGLGRSKMVYIITDRQEEMRDIIYKEVNRGVTKVPAYGGYTDAEKPMLLVVVYQTEFTKLKQVVKKVDPTAFVIVSDAYEVVGKGFKRA